MTTELPDDIEQLKQMLASLQHENQALSSNVDIINSEVEILSSKNKEPEYCLRAVENQS